VGLRLTDRRTATVSDLTPSARDVMRMLDEGDASAVVERLSQRIRSWIEQGWSLEDHLRDVWRPGVEDLMGSSRVITDEQHVSPTSVRLTVEGDRGRGLVTVSFEEDGTVSGFSLDREVYDGIMNLVITCPDERVDEMKAFYGALLGTDQWRVPLLVFDEGNDYHAPSWGDPDRPKQMHLDIRVRDLSAVEAVVFDAKATALHDDATHRTYADPISHPFCLYPDASPGGDGGPPGELWRVIIDCPSPRDLASFYAELIGMSLTVEAAPELVVIGRPDGRGPLLGFQLVDPYVPPGWPDPARPAQMHFDIKFDDAPAARSLAESLGAVLLPPGGSCPVYADPVGHPFCLCGYGQ
jgi:hypothetical protein